MDTITYICQNKTNIIMELLFEKIEQNREMLLGIDSQIENVKTLPYYDFIGTERERQKDLDVCYKAKRETLNEYQVLLENLQLEINKELHRVSQSQKENTLKSL